MRKGKAGATEETGLNETEGWGLHDRLDRMCNRGSSVQFTRGSWDGLRRDRQPLSSTRAESSVNEGGSIVSESSLAAIIGDTA